MNICFDAIVYNIETTNRIKLYNFQKRYLKNLLAGKKTKVPRACGKSIFEKYGFVTEYPEGTEYDDIITLDEIMDENPSFYGISDVLRRLEKNDEKWLSEMNVSNVEQLKKKLYSDRRGCEYCNRHKVFGSSEKNLINNYAGSIRVSANILASSALHLNVQGIGLACEINYCPMCGGRLK